MNVPCTLPYDVVYVYIVMHWKWAWQNSRALQSGQSWTGPTSLASDKEHGLILSDLLTQQKTTASYQPGPMVRSMNKNIPNNVNPSPSEHDVIYGRSLCPSLIVQIRGSYKIRKCKSENV